MDQRWHLICYAGWDEASEVVFEDDFPAERGVLSELYLRVGTPKPDGEQTVYGWFSAHVDVAAVKREPGLYKVFLGGGHLR